MKAVRGNEGNNGRGGEQAQAAAAHQKRQRSNKALASSPPTTLELRGIRVQFPFRPYACQETYMEKVLDALLKSENALLESPTGTGKTLCLLCAALAWQRQQKFSLDAIGGDATMTLQQQSRTSTALTTMSQTPAMAAPAAQRRSRNRTPTIIYASRTHSQLSQVVRELRNTVYRPKHAVLASREQMCVHPKVKKEQHSASDVNYHCNQLCKERKCKFRNNLEGFTAPDCGETAVSAGVGAGVTDYHCDNSHHTQPVRDMEDLIAMGKSLSICPFYYTRGQLETAELVLVPYNYLFDKEARQTTLKDVPWDNAIVIFDEAHNLESFASDSASFDLTNADLAGCVLELDRALNYLQSFGAAAAGGGEHSIKPDNVLTLKDIVLRLEKFILNLSDQQTTYSGEFMMEVFQRGGGINHANKGFLLQELRTVTEFIMEIRSAGSGGGRNSSSNGTGCPKIEHFVDCVKRVFDHELESRCIAKASYYRVHVSPKVPQTQQKTTSSTTANMGRTISYWCFAPAVAMEELSDLNIRSIIVTSGTLSPLPSYGMELGLSFPHTLENPHIIADHQIHVRVVGTGVSGKELSSSYERRKDGEYYAELGNTLVSLAKVVPGGMLVFFPSYGVMETCLERWGGPDMSPSSFRGGKNNKPNRNNFFAERRRKTVATGSSRYSFNRVQTSYYDTASGTAPLTPWKRLVAAKAVVVEPRTSGDLPDAIAEFQRYLDMPKSTGCVLMGVCRGKISEGIDFAHNMSRAVVITGLPFAPAFDPKVKLKKAYLDSAKASVAIKSTNDGGFGNGDTNKPVASTMKLSGNEWYTQQAHRAVNQAVGRVIRNRTDYGAVLLLDSRFGQPRNQEGLSKWLRPHIRKDEGFGQTIRSLASFYKEAKANEAKPAPVELSAPEKMTLEYEEEDEDVNVTKVALIRKQDDRENAGDGSTSSAYVAANQVLARIDAKAMMQKPTPSSHLAANDKSDDQPQKPPSNDAVFGSKKPTATARPNKKGAPALFMDKMKSLLSVADQSAIRKEIVTMKGHADRKDARAYRKSALVIVRLIVKCEKFETVTKNIDSSMLFLFFSLLPDAYRSDVETKAMKCVFETSTLGERCQKYLGPAELGRLQSAVVALLSSVWCSPDKNTIPRTTYLRQAQGVLSVLCKSDRHQARSMLEALLIIIPERWVDNTRLLCDELFAARNIENMKQKDKACVGQVTVKSERFLSAPSRTAVVNPPEGGMGGEPSKEAIKSESKSAPWNPYAQSLSKSRQPLASTVQSAAMISKATKPSVSKKKPASLASILETVESDTPFIKRTPGDIARTINSNAPDNLTCSLCLSSLKDNEPLIAECRHIACARCWFGWLKRSSTCPTCRVPTKKDSLARAVFK